MSLTNELLLAAVVMFGLYNFWRFFQVRSRRRKHGPQAVAAVREKAKSARAVTGLAEKAALFVEAGHLAREGLHDPDLAVAYYLRALRSDPSCEPALAALGATLSRPGSFRRLERIYWRLLSRVSPEGAARTTYLSILRALADLYARSYRHPARARALRRLLQELERT
jgi:hypothetical protein